MATQKPGLLSSQTNKLRLIPVRGNEFLLPVSCHQLAYIDMPANSTMPAFSKAFGNHGDIVGVYVRFLQSLFPEFLMAVQRPSYLNLRSRSMHYACQPSAQIVGQRSIKMTCIDVRDGVSIGFDSESVAQDSKVGISLEFAMDVTHGSNIRNPNLRKPFTPAPYLS